MQMHRFHIGMNRRELLRAFALTTAGLWVPEAVAEGLLLTPSATEGPYYPDHLPLDQDNDLTNLAGSGVLCEGHLAGFGGRLLNADGKPVEDAVIEVWQADSNGCYIHSRGTFKDKERDPGFQGYGKMTTNAKGEYRFKTIVPGLYPGRTRHWHVAVNRQGKRWLTTQLFLAGESQNDNDGVLRSMGTAEQQLSVIRDFKAQPGSDRVLVATWDIVLGQTASERGEGRGMRGGPPGGPGGPGDREGRPPRPKGKSKGRDEPPPPERE